MKTDVGDLCCDACERFCIVIFRIDRHFHLVGVIDGGQGDTFLAYQRYNGVIQKRFQCFRHFLAVRLQYGMLQLTSGRLPHVIHVGQRVALSKR